MNEILNNSGYKLILKELLWPIDKSFYFIKNKYFSVNKISNKV